MSEVIVHPNKKFKTINDEFQENFPYLMLAFFSKEDWEKADTDAGERVHALTYNNRIRDVRTTKPEDGDEISIHGNTIVKNLEDRFLKIFGIYVQVSFMDSKGNGYYSSNEQDKMTLTALNDFVKKEGLKKFPSVEEDDNSSVKTDQITGLCRALHENLRPHIPGLVSIAEYKHYASGQRVNSYREYYADIDDEDIESFMVEWDPEEEELYIGFCVLPPDKNKIIFKENLATACSKQGIDTDEYGCFKTIGHIDYDAVLTLDEVIIEDSAKLFTALKKIRKSLL